MIPSFKNDAKSGFVRLYARMYSKINVKEDRKTVKKYYIRTLNTWCRMMMPH